MSHSFRQYPQKDEDDIPPLAKLNKKQTRALDQLYAESLDDDMELMTSRRSNYQLRVVDDFLKTKSI